MRGTTEDSGIGGADSRRFSSPSARRRHPRLASGHTSANTWPLKRFPIRELGSAGWQRHELHPIAPTGTSNATDDAARMMNDSAHGVEDQKPQTLPPRAKIFLRQSQPLYRRHHILRHNLHP